MSDIDTRWGSHFDGPLETLVAGGQVGPEEMKILLRRAVRYEAHLQEIASSIERHDEVIKKWPSSDVSAPIDCVREVRQHVKKALA